MNEFKQIVSKLYQKYILFFYYSRIKDSIHNLHKLDVMKNAEFENPII